MNRDSTLAARLESYVDFDGELPASVDERAVRRMYALARLLDDGVPVPGTGARVGFDPLLGVLPVAGDLLVAVASSYLVVEAARQGVSRWTLLRMLANVGVDLVVGTIPVVGFVFDALWKANRRNLRLALADLASERAGGMERIELDAE